jgi:transposase
MTVLVDDLVPDQLWTLVEPLLPAPPNGVGEGRRVRRLASRGPGPAGRAGPAGLVAGQCGHHERAGPATGTRWAQFPSIVATREQAPPGLRRWWAAANRGGRWRIERALAWLSCFRRLQVRWDRDAGRWCALVLLACAVVCFNRL